MIRRPPRSTRTDTLFPYTTLFRSVRSANPRNRRASSGVQSTSTVTFMAFVSLGHCPRAWPYVYSRRRDARRRDAMAMIAIDTLEGDGRFPAYEAKPDGKPQAAIIVIQAIFGGNAGIRRQSEH